MAKNKRNLDLLCRLSWKDLEKWAGHRIVTRGKSYQRNGNVTDLAVVDEKTLIAYVDGTRKYSTKVIINKKGLPESQCSCPYMVNCKHGVAVVLEYLEWIEIDKKLPSAEENDSRMNYFSGEDEKNKSTAPSGTYEKEIEGFLKSRTKPQLVELILHFMGQYPEIKKELIDRAQFSSGNSEAMLTRLRSEIRNIDLDPDWEDQRYGGTDETTDYADIRKKLVTLVEMGCADEVLSIGEELIDIGIRKVERTDDDGMTMIDIQYCISDILNALRKSSLSEDKKIIWTVEVVLKDPFGICDSFSEYLQSIHSKKSWNGMADHLLERLKKDSGPVDDDDFHNRYNRDQISDWAIHALKHAGRDKEIIPLCESEAEKTHSYDRLTKRLISAKRYDEAENWIRKGLCSIGPQWQGISSSLRSQYRGILVKKKKPSELTAFDVEEFIRDPSEESYKNVRKTSKKINLWDKIRNYLLKYLENGTLPWNQKKWPLPESGLEKPEKSKRTKFPMIDTLIQIAILEKNPDQVLYWYDKRPKDWFWGYGFNDDSIAMAIQNHAPERAVEMWKKKAEGIIAQVKPNLYRDAVKFLQKAEKLMIREQKEKEWNQYMKQLRHTHARKIRLMDILDGRDKKPILRRRRRR